MHNAREAGDKMADPSKGSRIFAPYRALGFCCNDVPLRVYARGDSFLVATAVGKSHHVYNVSSGKGSSSEESRVVLYIASYPYADSTEHV